LAQRPAGAARLPVVVTAALLCFFFQTVLAYLLPLYFPGRGLPNDAWETWGFYTILTWMIGAPVAGVLGNRVGERVAWVLGVLIYLASVVIILFLYGTSFQAQAGLITAAALAGFGSVLIWIGNVSLTQSVPAEKRGQANGLMMAAVGLGATTAPPIGRLLVAYGTRLHALPDDPGRFIPALAVVLVSGMASAVLLWGWSQYPQADGAHAEPLRRTMSWLEALSIARSPVFLWIIIPLSLCSAPMFQAQNIYLPYKAAEAHIGLIQGAVDHGWAALGTLGNFMQFIGGLLVGQLAGKRISIRYAGLLLAIFAACCLGAGYAPSATWLFVACACFEIMRQFVRWLQTGYVSELVAPEIRPTAIGLSVMLSGAGAWGFTFLMRRLQSPNSPTFLIWLPYLIAAGIGTCGMLWLLVVRNPRQKDPKAR
jgi:MFS family permease